MKTIQEFKNEEVISLVKYILTMKEFKNELRAKNKHYYQTADWQAVSKWVQNLILLNTVEITKEATKIIDSHYNKLQAKAFDKVGNILTLDSLSDNYYRLNGDKGSTDIEIIIAGGYNIQRAHTRWIFKA